MIPEAEAHPLIQYWHEEQPPDEIEELLAQAQGHNPAMDHLVFDQASAAELIVAHHGARELAAFRACAVPAMQADYFRYCAVHALGGVYCDADISCSGPFTPLLEGRGRLLEGSGGLGVIANHLFGFRQPGHPLLGLAIEIATIGIESRFCERVTFVTGPLIFTALGLIHRLGSLEHFVEKMDATVAKLEVRYGSGPRLERQPWLDHLESIRSVVGDYERIESAFAGVAVTPFDRSPVPPRAELPLLAYKRSESHYPNWSASIFRDVGDP